MTRCDRVMFKKGGFRSPQSLADKVPPQTRFGRRFGAVKQVTRRKAPSVMHVPTCDRRIVSATLGWEGMSLFAAGVHPM